MLESFLQDLRYALRRIAGQPLYAVIIVVTLGLGIGANTAVFSLMDRIFLRPLPFSEEDRLISMFHRQEEGNRKLSATSYPDYEYYRDHNPVFADMMAFARVPAMVQIADRFESVIAELVTPNYFSVLRVPPPTRPNLPGGRRFERRGCD